MKVGQPRQRNRFARAAVAMAPMFLLWAAGGARAGGAADSTQVARAQLRALELRASLPLGTVPTARLVPIDSLAVYSAVAAEQAAQPASFLERWNAGVAFFEVRVGTRSRATTASLLNPYVVYKPKAHLTWLGTLWGPFSADPQLGVAFRFTWR